jgi:hypothetical protein
MYYPKSQIKTNLYTNGGEFSNSITNQPYQGYYYETSNGQLYTGKNPQDGPNILLSLQNSTALYDPTNVLDNPDFDNTIYYYGIADINYNDATNEQFGFAFNDTDSSSNGILFAAKYNNINCTPGVGWQKNVYIKNLSDGNFHQDRKSVV